MQYAHVKPSDSSTMGSVMWVGRGATDMARGNQTGHTVSYRSLVLSDTSQVPAHTPWNSVSPVLGKQQCVPRQGGLGAQGTLPLRACGHGHVAVLLVSLLLQLHSEGHLP